jgi:putative phage-type endonuclease
MLNNQDFTEERRHFIGGSDIGAILGLNPYKTPVDVWMEKTGKAREQSSNLAMRFGTFAEAFVASEYTLTTGLAVREPQNTFIHPELAFCRAHLDRLVYGETCTEPETVHPIRILECKTANPFRQEQWGESGTNQIPFSYLCQCVWYMAITDLPKTDLAVLFGNSDFRIYTIDRDLELEKIVLEKAQIFWNEHVIKDIPPQTSSEEDCKKLFEQSSPEKVIEADEALLNLAKEYQALLAKEQEIENGLDQIKQEFMNAMQDAESISVNNQELITWKKTKPTSRFDGTLFERTYPDLYKQFQKISTGSRRFVFKESALQAWKFGQGDAA